MATTFSPSSSRSKTINVRSPGASGPRVEEEDRVALLVESRSNVSREHVSVVPWKRAHIVSRCSGVRLATEATVVPNFMLLVDIGPNISARTP